MLFNRAIANAVYFRKYGILPKGYTIVCARDSDYNYDFTIMVNGIKRSRGELVKKGLNMRFLTEYRTIEAWYDALLLTNHAMGTNLDFDFKKTFRTFLSWHKGQMCQYFEVKIKDCWICDIKNRDGLFTVSQRGNRFKKAFDKNLVEFIKLFINNLLNTLEQQWLYDYFGD